MKLKHGGNIYAFPQMLDFSANINPLGMPNEAKLALAACAESCIHYPDPDCTHLTERLAAVSSIPKERIVCGNGAADLIYRIVYGFHPHRAVVCEPCFSEYREALEETGCQIYSYPLYENNCFRLQNDFLSFIPNDTDLIFLCTPNNPTGQCIEPVLLQQIADYCLQRKILLICDECFLDFSLRKEQLSLKQYMNPCCVILKAFTKIYALAGLRLGYALCGSEQIAQEIKQTGQFWSVSVPAQLAGSAALTAEGYLEQTINLITDERRFLQQKLMHCGIQVFPSEANFLLLKTGSDFGEFLQTEQIMVRSCANFTGLNSSFFRIAVRTHEENIKLIEAAERYMHGKSNHDSRNNV